MPLLRHVKASPLLIALSLSVLCACGGALGGDGRREAIQTALDADPPSQQVFSGRWCDKVSDKYRKVALVHIKDDGTQISTYPRAEKQCYLYSWEPSAHIASKTIPITGTGYFTAAIGRFIIDKVGTEADVSTGFGTVKATPFKAHFQVNEVGKQLIAAGIATPAPDISDGQVALHKDADGKWIVTR